MTIELLSTLNQEDKIQNPRLYQKSPQVEILLQS